MDETVKIALPEAVRDIIHTLQGAGYEALSLIHIFIEK